MDFNSTIDLIIKDLNDACRIIDDLKSYEGVPELQVEFAKAKCKSAADVISLLKNIQQKPADKPVRDAKETAAPHERKEEPEIPEKNIIPAPASLTAEKKTTQKQVREKNIPVQPVIHPEVRTDKEEEGKGHRGTTIIADQFKAVPSSINEQLGIGKEDMDLTDRLISKPIGSLKDAIGLNDRFLFQREVFNGDIETYNQAITKLETAESEEDARTILRSYTGTDEENEATLQLLGLVKRKLGQNE